MASRNGRFDALDPDKVVQTLVKLEARIRERFPGAGLAALCHELIDIARRSKQRARAIARPAYLLRISTFILILIGLFLLLRILVPVMENQKSDIQALEAIFNIVVLTGAAIFFLIRIEERVKRARALTALNELRAIVHVIDMHQLTKDPMTIAGPRTSSSPERSMTRFQLTRYLDYCTEMLSLTAKIAAVYAQSTSDAVVIDAASDLTTLTINLSSKIWQKITLIATTDDDGAMPAHPLPPTDPEQHPDA